MSAPTEFTDAPRDSVDAKPPVSAPSSTPQLVVDPAREKLVAEWLDKVKAAKKHWKPVYKRMDDCMQLAAAGADEEWEKSDKYTAAITNRHINVSVAQLYARDPRAVAKRKKKLLFKLWDGDPKTYQMALQLATPPQGAPQVPGPDGTPITVVQGPNGPQPWQADPNAMAIVQEVTQALEQNRMVDRLGQALELLWNYYTSEQSNGFKQEAKAAVRRTKVCSVSYIKLLFQRELKRNPDIGAQIDDMTQQLSVIEARKTELAAGEIDPDSAKAEELRNMIAKLAQNPDYQVVGREGPVFDFPDSKDIIPDPKMKHLKTFKGCDWVAQQFEFTPEEILEIYKIDVRGRFTEHKTSSDTDEGGKKKCVARVYEVQHKKNCEVFTVCEGYPDFIAAPAEPDVKIERFWNLIPIVFNESEGDKFVFPYSDVWLLRHSAAEINRSREGLREHRKNSRPKWATHKGSMSEADRSNFESAPAFTVTELKSLKPGMSVDSLLQAMKPHGIDPNVYDVAQNMQDIERTVGTQQANLGGTSSKGSATESSISEQSRTVSISDNIDDLDDALTELAHAFGQLCLMELSAETVAEICGPGAPWPQMQGNRAEISKDLYLDIKAGSSGRPNQAAELASLERVLPYLIQLPGIPPKPLAERLATLTNLDLDDIYEEGLPSISALNMMMGKQMQASTGNPATDPSAQGGQGTNKAPNPQQNEPQGQPAYPA